MLCVLLDETASGVLRSSDNFIILLEQPSLICGSRGHMLSRPLTHSSMFDFFFLYFRVVTLIRTRTGSCVFSRYENLIKLCNVVSVAIMYVKRVA